MARADLALAAGLTTVFPVLSAFLTPIVCELALKAVPDAGAIRFNLFGVLLTLVATITLPLAVGMLIHHRRPALGQRLLRPVEVVSEAVGALSLAFVTVTEFGAILQTGWQSLLAMGLVAELSLGLGYWLGGGSAGSRQVVALGTSNRNIALALLVAVQSFAGTPVMSAVVANGLLLILLGLVHVAYWRVAADVQEALTFKRSGLRKPKGLSLSVNGLKCRKVLERASPLALSGGSAFPKRQRAGALQAAGAAPATLPGSRSLCVRRPSG